MAKINDRFHEIINASITGQQVYFLAFAFYFVPAFLIDTTFTQYLSWSKLRLLTYIAIPLIIFKIYVIDKWHWPELLLITALLLIGIVCWRAAHYPEILMMMIFVLGAKNVQFRKIVQWYFYLSLVFLLILAVIAIVGIIPNLIYYSRLRPTRYSLGMAYTTFVSSHIIYITLAYCYLRFNKLSWLDYIGILVVAFIALKLTNTRLDFYEMLLLIPVMWIAQRAQRGKKFSQVFASFWWTATPLLAAITLIGAYFYSSSNQIYRKLNSLFTGRLSLSYEAFQRYPVSLLGRKIVEHSFGGSKGVKFANNNLYELSSHYFYIDSSYVRMLLVWGGVVFLLVLGGIIYIVVRETAKKRFALPSIFVLIAINAMFEPHILQLIYNPFLIAVLATIGNPKLIMERKHEQ